jgi:adenosylmethionine-8-amino-7-oxononanoate aminotransferase
MSTHPAQLKSNAVDNIILHDTPRQWLNQSGPLVLERGNGAVLHDVGGREYLDTTSGGMLAVLTGYGREEIARAMYEQALKLNYTSPASVTSEVTIELADKLAALAPGDLGASFFCTSGSEAVEAAIKLARQYHEASGEGRRYKVVSLRRSSHGATVGALSASGGSPHFQDLRRAVDPVVPALGYVSAMPPYCYRCELGLTYSSCSLACATTLEQAIVGSDPELVSCVILEPVIGTGGCIIPPPGYLARVRQICDRYGILLIADEVVCGFGRTGRWFGVDHVGVVPDIMVVAKGLTGGYAPMAAAIARRGIAEKLPIFFDLHTYGGHPVSAAAALANLRIIEREGLVENSAVVGAYMLDLLKDLRSHPSVCDIRGLGLLMAVEMHDPFLDEDFAPEQRVAEQVTALTLEMGLLGPRPLGGSTLLFAPPLIFTRAQAEQSVEILDAALSKVEDSLLARTAR